MVGCSGCRLVKQPTFKLGSERANQVAPKAKLRDRLSKRLLRLRLIFFCVHVYLFLNWLWFYMLSGRVALMLVWDLVWVLVLVLVSDSASDLGLGFGTI